MEATTNAIVTAVGDMVDIVTSSVVPMATSTPFVYFLAIGLIGGAIGLFAKFRHSV